MQSILSHVTEKSVNMYSILANLTQISNENQKPTATGEHFNLSVHSIYNMMMSVLEKVTLDSIVDRKIHESIFINKFETKHCGLNRKM